MKSIKHLAFVAIVLCFVSCKKEIKYQKTSAGLEYYYFEKADTGTKGKPGYYYLVDMIGQREDDSVFIDSYKLGQKIKLVRTHPPFHSLFNDALGMLRKGDSVIFKMKADSFFRPLGQSRPKYLKPNENIRFTMKVKDILDPEAHLLMMYVNELDKMLDYVKLKKWNVNTDMETGIKSEILKKGNGLKAKEGDEIEVSYFLTYLNGKIIFQSNPGDKITLGSPDNLKGMNKLILLAEEGAKLRALLPFAEACGVEGSRYVDPYATLVMEMEIIKINKK